MRIDSAKMHKMGRTNLCNFTVNRYIAFLVGLMPPTLTIFPSSFAAKASCDAICDSPDGQSTGYGLREPPGKSMGSAGSRYSPILDTV